MLRTRSLRGPVVYATGGFDVTLPDIEHIAFGSGTVGRKVAVDVVSSSYFYGRAVSHSGNIVTIEMHDARSGYIEAAASEDLSLVDLSVIYEGY